MQDPKRFVILYTSYNNDYRYRTFEKIKRSSLKFETRPFPYSPDDIHAVISSSSDVLLRFAVKLNVIKKQI